MTVWTPSYSGLLLKNDRHKKKKKEKKFGHPIHIPYYATWKSSESNDTVRVQHFYLPNWKVCLLAMKGKRLNNFSVSLSWETSHLKWAEIFILKTSILKITSWLTWQFITKLPNAKLTVRLKSLSLNIAKSKESMRFYHHSLWVFGNQGVIELQERKREKEKDRRYRHLFLS